MIDQKLSSRAKLQTVLLLLASFGLAIAAQHVLADPRYPLDGPVYYLIAIGIFIWVIARDRDVALMADYAPAIVRQVSWWPALIANRRLALAGGALVMALLAFITLTGNRYTGVNVFFWLSSIVLFVMAFATAPTIDWRARLRALVSSKHWSIQVSWASMVLVAIILLGIFFRVNQLHQIPAEMTSDHAEKLLDVNDVLNGKYSIFFPRNTGREDFQFYLTAAIIRLLGLPIGFLALKLGTALFGIVAIPFAYLLAKEMYGREAGLLTAAFLAISQWHTAITRVGLRFPFTAAFAAPSLYFLMRAFHTNQRNDWLLAGLFLGIGLHAYTPMRAVAVLLVLLVGLKLLWDLVEARLHKRTGMTLAQGAELAATSAGEVSALTTSFWINALLSAGMAVLVFLPLLRYMLENPTSFWGRVLTRTSSLEQPLPPDLLSVFLNNVKNALLMFNVRGDAVWVNTVPYSPVLDYVSGGLFVLGVVYALWRLVRGGDRRSAYLITMLLMLLMPSILSLAFPVENPSVVRAGGAVPVVMIFVALPLALAVQQLDQVAGLRGKWIGWMLAAAILLYAAQLNYRWYFSTYAEQFRQTAWNSSEMGQVVRGFATSIGDAQHAYHVAYPYWVDTRNIGINMGDVTWNNAILDIERVQAHVQDPAPKLYLLHPKDEKSIARLKELFPRGQLREFKSATLEKDFLVFFVPGR